MRDCPGAQVLPRHLAQGDCYVMIFGNKHQNNDIHRLGNQGKCGREEEKQKPPHKRENTFYFLQWKLKQVYYKLVTKRFAELAKNPQITFLFTLPTLQNTAFQSCATETSLQQSTSDSYTS